MLENDGEEAKPKSFYWKGKKVSEKVYNQRRKQQELGKNVRSIYGTKKVTPNLKQAVENPNEDTKIEKGLVEGRRIVHIDTLAHQMFCKKCKSKLHFTDVEGEKQYGLASIFYIRCEKCKVLCSVATDKQHTTTQNRKHFDINTKAVIGTVNAGMGSTHLNTLLAALNMSTLQWKTFKAHEKEIGVCVEEMSIESCKRAGLEEKRLTIENLHVVKKLL